MEKYVKPTAATMKVEPLQLIASTGDVDVHGEKSTYSPLSKGGGFDYYDDDDFGW